MQSKKYRWLCVVHFVKFDCDFYVVIDQVTEVTPLKLAFVRLL